MAISTVVAWAALKRAPCSSVPVLVTIFKALIKTVSHFHKLVFQYNDYHKLKNHLNKYTYFSPLESFLKASSIILQEGFH